MGATGIRMVGDDEVAHFKDHGWVRLEKLISSQLAARLLERAKAIMGPDGGQHVAREGIDSPTNPWQDRHNIIEDDSEFASVGLSAEMGENAQRLMGRPIGVLLYNNLLAVKIGSKQNSSAPVSPPTAFHQDGGSLPLDRNGRIAFWIALDHITAEMGSMRYVDGSHHLGSLGDTGLEDGTQGSPFDVYPELNKMTLTEPMEFFPGDAAAHAMYALHEAPANQTECPRWTFIVSHIPSDTIYNGATVSSKPTQKKVARSGLVPGTRFGGPFYPRLFG